MAHSINKLLLVNCISLAVFTVTIILCSCIQKKMVQQKGYTLVWQDEFNIDGSPDSSKWIYENGFVRNHELQWYTPKNASCKNGLLTIEARRENLPNPYYDSTSKDWRKSRKDIRYTSSCLLTKDKNTWKYGRFIMRARIDTVPGYWPAWWTLGVSKPWPSNGEIDIMEFYRGKILANYAIGGRQMYKAHWYSNTFAVGDFKKNWKNNFHIWQMDWDDKSISIYMDGKLLNYQLQDSLINKDGTGFFPFKQHHYMILNLAIGGDNGGNPAATKFPLKYEIDYVRVYQKK